MLLFTKSERLYVFSTGILHSRDSLDLDGGWMHNSFLLKTFKNCCKICFKVIGEYLT